MGNLANNEDPDEMLHKAAFSQGLHCLLRLKLEDLKVLKCSPDLFNNVKIGQGQLQLIMKHILFYQPFWSSDLSNLMDN